MTALKAGLPANKGDSKPVTNFNLAELLPMNIQAYRYSGSLTTPPCTEGVSWFVMTEAKQMSSQQILAFQSVFGGSNFPDGTARPVRLLNARQIVVTGSLPR